MSATTEVRRYQFKDLNEKQQQELERYIAFLDSIKEFEKKVTEQTFAEIFGNKGHHLWEMFIDRAEKDILQFVFFGKFLGPDPHELTGLFFYLLEGKILGINAEKLNQDMKSKLQGSYGFIDEVIAFGNFCRPTTLAFLFGDDGENLSTIFRKVCDKDALKFAFGDHLSPEQKSILLCNILMHSREHGRFENFGREHDVNMLRSI